MAAFDFAVAPGSIGPDELVNNSQLSSSALKQHGDIPLAVGKPVGEFKAVFGLDTFHSDSAACIPLCQPLQEISGGVSRLFRIGGEETQADEFVNGGVQVKAQLRVGDTAAGTTLTSTWTRWPRKVIRS